MTNKGIKYKKSLKRKSTAWCECGDALETIPIMRKHPYYGEIIHHYESVSGRANDVYSLGESEQEVIK